MHLEGGDRRGDLGTVLSSFSATVYDCPVDVRPGFVYHPGNVIAFFGLGEEDEGELFSDLEVRRHPHVASFSEASRPDGEASLLMSRFDIYRVYDASVLSSKAIVMSCVHVLEHLVYFYVMGPPNSVSCHDGGSPVSSP